MSSIYDKASLVLIPSGSKTSKVYSQKPTNGDGDFTFSRSTAATRVNASGNIEKETQNLLLQSNGFSTSPFTTSNTSVTGGQAGYDGTNNAWSLTSNGTNGFENLHQIISFSGVYTISVYAKQGSNDYLTIRTLGDDLRVQFKLDDGTHSTTFGSPIDTFMEDAGGGWYRCGFTANFSSATYVLFYPQRIGITTAGSIYIQDAQLEQSLVARDYIETTTTAVEGGITDNVPRLDYTDSSCPSILLEPQRTNVMTYSEGLKIGLGINYKSSGVTLTPNDAESPEGYNNATKFDGGLNDIADTYTGYTASTTNTFSAFLKAGTCDIAKMKHTATGAVAEITINLTSGTITNTTGAQYLDSSIVDYGDGWYRASITFTSGTTAYITRVQLGEAGYIHMYGWQIERGASYPTSYIPTYGSAVTRNQDTLQLTGMSSDVASGATSGTLMIEFDYTQQSFGDVVQWYSSSTAIGRGYLYNRSIGFADTWGGAGNALDTTDGVNTKVIWRLDSLSSGTFFKDGVKGNDVDTTTQAWNNIDNLYIRGHYGTINVRQIIFVPYALSNQEAIDLTTL